MSTTWYTSDLHIGHRLVAELRGFGDITAHDASLADIWSAVVGERDQVWILGDLSLNPDHGLAWLRELPGVKHLVAGNHDRCHPGHRDAHKEQRHYLEVFASVQAFARHRIGGIDVLLSHFPYAADRVEKPREMQWRLRDEGALLLHGHTHASGIRTSAREWHVGWDAWGAPVARHVLAAQLTKPIEAPE